MHADLFKPVVHLALREMSGHLARMWIKIITFFNSLVHPTTWPKLMLNDKKAKDIRFYMLI